MDAELGLQSTPNQLRNPWLSVARVLFVREYFSLEGDRRPERKARVRYWEFHSLTYVVVWGWQKNFLPRFPTLIKEVQSIHHAELIIRTTEITR